MKLINGNCLEEIKKMESNSIDAIVTDPPYELGFMGKSWDSSGIANNVELWKECLRILKPGGHLLAFSGTRTYHRMASAIEDAGFEVRDMIEWVYGSGFPKSLNIAYAIEGKIKIGSSNVKDFKKLEGEEYSQQTGYVKLQAEQGYRPDYSDVVSKKPTLTTEQAKQWEGWGTALKPAHEPIVWATKSLTNANQFAILEDINNNLISTIWQSLENLQKQDTSKLQETVLIHLNTALLWQNILAELLKNESKFTTSTVSKMTTELKILNSLLLKNTQDDTDGKSQTYQNGTQESQVNGLDLLVSIVENCLAGEKKNMTDIQTLIAQGLATYKQSRTGMNVKNVEQDLLPIILNANSVLINVLTDITTELNQNELNTFVSFAEKSLKQYLAEPQNIADENVWQEHIQKALPNHNPICMARKPLSEKTVAENCLKWGTGGINIDESRVETPDIEELEKARCNFEKNQTHKMTNTGQNFLASKELKATHGVGRFPANLIHDNSEEVRECFPETKSTSGKKNPNGMINGVNKSSEIYGEWNAQPDKISGFDDSGNASRFFKSIIYQAKASKSERNKGADNLIILEVVCEDNMEQAESQLKDMCESIKKWLTDLFGSKITEKSLMDISSIIKTETSRTTILIILNLKQHLNIKEYIADAFKTNIESGGSHVDYAENTSEWKQIITKELTEFILGVNPALSRGRLKINVNTNNFHATVKPIALMKYLIKMVSREGATILDPFMGSGSTGVACRELGREFIGIEMSPEYMEIAKKRIGE